MVASLVRVSCALAASAWLLTAATAAADPANEARADALRREMSMFDGLFAAVAPAQGASPGEASPWTRPSAGPQTAAARGAPSWRASIEDVAAPGGLRLAVAPAQDEKAAAIPLAYVHTVGRGEGVRDLDAFDHRGGPLDDTYWRVLDAKTQPRLDPARADGAWGTPRSPRWLQADDIRRVVRRSFDRFRLCYEPRLRTDPTLHGRVAVKLTIEPDGSVATAADAASDLPDAGVVDCVVRAFATMAFPPSGAGRVTVVYPLVFHPTK